MMILPFKIFAQDPAVLLREAAGLESEFKENEAFLKYAEILKLQPTSLFALCKCSDLCCRIGSRQSDKAKKIDYFKAGRTYAETAYRLNPNNCDANVAMAFSMARMAIIEGGKEKVIAANAIKQYAEKAIQCDPYNFKAYHILGRWHYEISGMNGVEKTLAKWFCGPLPEASLGKSIQFFEKSKSLDPAFIPNYLELARAYNREGQKGKAIGMLNYMMTLPDKMYDDRRAKSEGRQLLEDWK
jgi:tetratricopeptide (TPR) repeat protein